MPGSFNLGAGGDPEWSVFADAVGMVIRVCATDGKPLQKGLVRTTQVSQLVAEPNAHGRLRVREQLPQQRPPPLYLPDAADESGTAEASAQTLVVIRVLQRHFPTMIHAFALFDADDGNAVGLRETRNAIAWLYRREKERKGNDRLPDKDLAVLADFDAKAFIRELTSSTLAGRGATVSIHDFFRRIRFGDSVEDWKRKLEIARAWRNKLLSEALFKENLYISGLGTEFLGELKECLEKTFENAAEAFVFFDKSCAGQITEAAWGIGLRRLGLHINVKHLLMVLDGSKGSASDGIVDESEFRAFFAWHNLEGWDEMMINAKKNRKRTANRVTMELFNRSDESGMSERIPDSTHASDEFPQTKFLSGTDSKSLVVGNLTFEGSGKRGAAQWQREFFGRLATVVDPPAKVERFVFVGFQAGDIVLAILPDASDLKRDPQTMAILIHDALKNPGNSVRTWDPSVQGSSEGFVMKNHRWCNTSVAGIGLFDEGTTNSLLHISRKVSRDHLKFPRSDVGFKTLGALDHWRCIDGIGKVGAVRDTFPLSLLRHGGNGTLLELMHHSPGFVFFQVERDGPVLCCGEDGRVRERSDLQLKGDGKGPEWKFHSAATVEKFEAEKGLDLKTRFTNLSSPSPGRWIVGISVPYVILENKDSLEFQIALTPSGFVIMGGGDDPRGLIVDRNIMRTTSKQEAIDFIRHHPAKPDDPTELDELAAQQNTFKEGVATVTAADAFGLKQEGDEHGLSERQHQLKMQLESFFESQSVVQESHADMLVQNGFRASCSLLCRLLDLLSLGRILEPAEKINRRALLVRVCGDYGKQCVPGTGTSTHLGFLLDAIKGVLRKGEQPVVLASFFRMQYHQPQEVIAHLVRQLSATIPENAAVPKGLTIEVLKALDSCSHEKLAMLLHRIIMYHMLRDTPVVMVLDNLHLAEQRVLGLLINQLRGALQPWFYPVKRQGYVRVVFSGRDGYSAPSGCPLVTLQLHRLSESGIKKVLTKMLRLKRKHVAPEHIDSLLKKKDACRMQYLRVLSTIVSRFWVFEQINGYFEALPDLLSDLYFHALRHLEDDFGEDLVSQVLVLIVNSGAASPKTFSDLDRTFASNPQISALLQALRELLRLAPAATHCELHDDELAASIRKRYLSGTLQEVRIAESAAREREKVLRHEQRENCVAAVREQYSGVETGCSSLHQAVNAAAAGDEVIICDKKVHLKHGLLIDRELQISCRHPGTIVDIGYGQTLLQVGNDEMHRMEPQPRFTVLVQGLTMKQSGFEAAENPVCVRVSANAELQMVNCDITSDRSIGVQVADGSLAMEKSRILLCGSQSLDVQEGGETTLSKCQLVANWVPNVSPCEAEMHEMFIAFCKGESAASYTRREEVDSQSQNKQIKLSGLGKRGTTLDFSEFVEVMKYLKLCPGLMTRTQMSSLFTEANQGQSADKSESELDWVEFKALMHKICLKLDQDGFMGVSREELLPRTGDRDHPWKVSNGAVVRGGGAKLLTKDTEFLNCVIGCLVKGGATAQLDDSKFICCGRDRTDAASLSVSGKGSIATCRGCEFDTSDHHGVKADSQAAIILINSKVINVRQHGVLVLGRLSKVALDGCEMSNFGQCGLRANQKGYISVMNTSIKASNDAAILASFLGTRIDVNGGVTIGSADSSDSDTKAASRSIVAENEGAVFVCGDNKLHGTIVARRGGRIEEPNRRFQQSSPHNSIPDGRTTEASAHAGTTTKKWTKSKEDDWCKNHPETARVMHQFAKVFDNAAEAFVMLDEDAGGGISVRELELGLKRLDITGIDMDKLCQELRISVEKELDPDAFIHFFMWHDMNLFPDSSWQMGYVEASRQRRRIAARFCERTGIEGKTKKSATGSKWRQKLVADEMAKRLRVQRKFEELLGQRTSKIDHRKERKAGIQYIQAGQLYRSKAKLRLGESDTKCVSFHGLPGVLSKYRDPVTLISTAKSVVDHRWERESLQITDISDQDQSGDCGTSRFLSPSLSRSSSRPISRSSRPSPSQRQ